MNQRTRIRPAARSGTRWVSLSHACDVLGVDESTIRRWADSGRLRAFRTPGGHRRFLLNDLEAMVNRDSQRASSGQLERLAVVRIKRQLHAARQQEDGWYGSLSDANRKQLRDLGRSMINMVGQYLDRRSRRGALLEEALEVGHAYGRILIDAGLPLASAIGAYIGFRKTMDETTRQMAQREGLTTDKALDACGQVHALGDQVLIGISAAYEAENPTERSGETHG